MPGLYFRISRIPSSGWEPRNHANLNPGDKPVGNPSDLPNNPATSSSERRTAPRYEFSATAEVTDNANLTKISGRITEISRSGCYVDALNTLPRETVVSISISCDQGTFLTQGRILYVQDRIGMGVVFLDPADDQMKILDSWLVTIAPKSAP